MDEPVFPNWFLFQKTKLIGVGGDDFAEKEKFTLASQKVYHPSLHSIENPFSQSTFC
jgi:hypothetical protein